MATSSSNRTILQPRSRMSMAGSSKQSSSSIQSPTPIMSSVRRAQPVPLQDRSFEEQQRIHNAATKREENELLVWTSLERNESLPQTKLHYERDMLFIDSDEEEGSNNGGRDDESGGSGSIEWEETHDWDSEDERRMRQGVSFGPAGWWDPKYHKSAEERIEAEKVEVEREKRRREKVGSGKVKIKREDEVSQTRSPQSSRRRSSGYGSGSNTPGRRKSGGKRAFGTGSSPQS